MGERRRDSDAGPRTGETDGHALRDGHPVGGLSLDEAFGLLADRRRRFTLHALADASDGVTDLSSLARAVAANEAPDDANGAVARERIETALAEAVLPRLDEAGLLDFDRRTGAVRYYGHPVVEEYAGHVAPIEWDD